MVYSNFFVGTCIQASSNFKTHSILVKTAPLASKAARVGFVGIVYTFWNLGGTYMKMPIGQTWILNAYWHSPLIEVLWSKIAVIGG